MLLQRERCPRSSPLWLRLAAVFCILLVIAASTVQVCHTHEELQQHSRNSPPGPAVPDHCPLCVAMHSAMPAVQSTAHVEAPCAQAMVQAVQPLRHTSPHAFELQSRPPPAL